MDRTEQRKVVEALIMASSEPVSADRLARIVPQLNAAGAKDLVNELNTEYQDTGRAFEVWEVAGGYQLRTLAEFSGYLQQLRKERPLRLSQAALATYICTQNIGSCGGRSHRGKTATNRQERRTCSFTATWHRLTQNALREQP